MPLYVDSLAPTKNYLYLLQFKKLFTSIKDTCIKKGLLFLAFQFIGGSFIFLLLSMVRESDTHFAGFVELQSSPSKVFQLP